VASTPLKNISQLGLLFPIYIYIYIYGKIKFMFQTTNQLGKEYRKAWSSPNIKNCGPKI